MSRSTERNVRCIVHVTLSYINRRDVERHCPTKTLKHFFNLMWISQTLGVVTSPMSKQYLTEAEAK
jgi:hypothetical protein